jgi:outer membrane protein assembly factor BamA
MRGACRRRILVAAALTLAGACLEPARGAEAQRNWVALPALGYSTDTGWMGGGALMRLYGCSGAATPAAVPECSRSHLALAGLYSQKQQLLLSLGGDNSWGGQRHRLVWGAKYRRFPSRFYGIGRAADLDEGYTPRESAAELAYLRRLGGGWELGLAAAISRQYLERESLEPGGVLETRALVGSRFFVRTGVGPRLLLDRRDSPWQPRRGAYLSVWSTLYRRALGGDLDGERHGLDARGYWSAGAGCVVAGQLTLDDVRGEIPFDELPSLGGGEALRGYPGGRYRDRSRLLAQVEVRRPALLGRLGLALFAGAGDVAPALERLAPGQARLGAGGGLRYLYDRASGLTLRLDYGVGEAGERSMAITLGEAF